jgi:hypothetical protein
MHVPLWLTCVVLSGYFSCKVDYLFESPWHPRIWMKACSLRSNVKHQTLWWFALFILGWHWLFCSHGKNVISYTAWVTLAWLAYVANLLLLINITWLIITFKRWLVIAASRHESVPLWSLCMFRIRGIRPRWISPVERSHPSLCSCCFYMHVCRWGCSSFFWWRWRGLSVGGPDRWGLGFLLGLVGVGHPMKLTLF